MNNTKPKNFAIIGVAGYIAPRHLKAIKDTGNNLVAAMDINDSVGILDKYFKDVPFFSDFDEFDNYLRNFIKNGNKLHYVSICSPNYLHGTHMKFAKSHGAHAICEKPLLTTIEELEDIEAHEMDNDWKVYSILQVREHPSIKKIKKQLEQEQREDKYEVDLTYITARGPWYLASWKGDVEKSGGLAMNIGIHFFDMLIWMFGDVQKFLVYQNDKMKITGYMELEKANVKWYLSIDRNDLAKVGETKNPAYRSIKFDGEEIEFSNVFTDLHTVVYQNILSGGGTGIKDARPTIELLYNLNNKKTVYPEGDKHHYLFEVSQK